MKPFAYFAYVALGSNLGNSVALIGEAMKALEKLSVEPIKRSSFWKSGPVDCPAGSPDFINAAVALAPFPEETPETLLVRLQQIEKEFGRRPKTVLNEARPLDLDLIAFRDERRNTPELILPHPRAHLRLFVLAPLAEIAAELVLPGQKKSVREWLSDLKGVQIIKRIGR